MGKASGNEAGFSAIELIIAVVIIVAVGGVGWFVWHAKQHAGNAQKTADLSSQAPEEQAEANIEEKDSAQSPTASAGSAVPAVQYITLDEYKIKFKIPAGLDGLEAGFGATRPNGPSAEEAVSWTGYTFTTKRTRDLGGGCETEGVLGISYYAVGPAVDYGPSEDSVLIEGRSRGSGVYFYDISPFHTCSTGALDIQQKDYDLIHDMVLHPIPF